MKDFKNHLLPIAAISITLLAFQFLIYPRYLSASIIGTNTITAGGGDATGTITTSGNYDLVLRTGHASSGTITIPGTAANGEIVAAVNGTGSFTISGAPTLGASLLTVKNTNSGSVGSVLMLDHDATGGVNNSVGVLAFRGNNSASSNATYASLSITTPVITAGAEVGKLFISLLNGSGSSNPVNMLQLYKDTSNTRSLMLVGDSAANAWITSNGNYDLVLGTGNTTTGTITIADGANQNITLLPDGTGSTVLSNGDLQLSDGRQVLGFDLSLTCASGGGGRVVNLSSIKKSIIVIAQNADGSACQISFTNGLVGEELFLQFQYTGAGALTFASVVGHGSTFDPNSSDCEGGTGVTEADNHRVQIHGLMASETDLMLFSCHYGND